MQNNTQRIIAYFLSTVKILGVSDQYCFNFYFHEIEQKKYIMCAQYKEVLVGVAWKNVVSYHGSAMALNG